MKSKGNTQAVQRIQEIMVQGCGLSKEVILEKLSLETENICI
ncbi:hypothetical protein LEP1GSC061_2967 [Leptospira wolffii serovar Khorat str. Khorat-H2]|nr:hypothetical protein LEP1GSC061_2967 [Leptospira wolffii serovar Khorat str. Khorat-H2]